MSVNIYTVYISFSICVWLDCVCHNLRVGCVRKAFMIWLAPVRFLISKVQQRLLGNRRHFLSKWNNLKVNFLIHSCHLLGQKTCTHTYTQTHTCTQLFNSIKECFVNSLVFMLEGFNQPRTNYYTPT